MRILTKFGENIPRLIANGAVALSADEYIFYGVYSFGSKEEESTVKDVGAEETVEHAVNEGANVIVNFTQGNNGQALKKAVHSHNHGLSLEDMIKVVHIIPDVPWIEESLGSRLKGFDYSIPLIFGNFNKRWLDPEDRVRLAHGMLRTDSHFDIRKIVDVTHYVSNEYVKQAREILQDKIEGGYLDFLAIPVGSGRVYVAFYRALQQLLNEGQEIKTKLVGIVPENEHPIYHKFVFNGNKIRRYNPTSIADKLSCPNTDLLPELKKAQEDGSPFVQVNNEEIERAMKDYDRKRTVSMHCGRDFIPMLEPSGAVGFVLMNPQFTKHITKTTRIGIFTTGMGIYMPLEYAPSSIIFSVDKDYRITSIK